MVQHIVFMCCVWISEQTATFALYNIKKTDFVWLKRRMFTEQYAMSPFTEQTNFVFKDLNKQSHA